MGDVGDGRGCTDTSARSEEGTGNTGMFAGHGGCWMKINWHVVLSSFVRRENLVIDNYITGFCGAERDGRRKCTVGCLCVLTNVSVYHIP